MAQDKKLVQDLDLILKETAAVGTTFDELTLLRTALHLYKEGKTAQEAIALAADMLSNALTNNHKRPT